MRISRWSLAALALCLAATAFAAGDDDDKGGSGPQAIEARKRFADGNDRYARGDYDGAIEAFRAAIAADPSLPGPYRNLGLVYRAQDKCREALPLYEKYLALKPESRFTDRVRREIDLCRSKLGLGAPPTTAPRATGEVHPPTPQSYLFVAANLIGAEATDEASVRVDGVPRGSTPLTIPVTPGKHRVHLEHPGWESADAGVDVPPGQRAEVELTMNKLPTVEPPKVTAVEPEPAKPKGSYRKIAWALMGVAGGLAILGAGFGIAESALHADAVTADKATTTREQIDRKRDTGDKYAVAAYVGLSAGAAALAASLILFIVDPARKETHDPQRYTLSPTVTQGGAGIAAAGRF